jgi:hypothetical protein
MLPLCVCISFPLPLLILSVFPLQDSTLIMQLLRDNLTLWTSDMQVGVVSRAPNPASWLTCHPQEEGGDAQGGDDGRTSLALCHCVHLPVLLRSSSRLRRRPLRPR